MLSAENNYKKRFAKILLALSLFLSVFSFNGFAGNFLAKEIKATQTEVVISTLSRTTTRAVYYKRVISACPEILTYSSFKPFIFEHKRLIGIQLDHLSKQERVLFFLLSHHKLFPADQSDAPAGSSIKG